MAGGAVWGRRVPWGGNGNRINGLFRGAPKHPVDWRGSTPARCDRLLRKPSLPDSKSGSPRPPGGPLCQCVYHLLPLLACAGFDVLPARADIERVEQIQYQTNEQFIQQAFGGAKAHWKILWLRGDLKKQVAKVLGHAYVGMRVRYWIMGGRTAWIIDEIGKDLPITVGVVVENNAIQQLSILVYREERGGEVHEDSFTNQFHQVHLLNGDKLSRKIDGITGATLSVHAVERVAKLTLFLNQEVMSKKH